METVYRTVDGQIFTEMPEAVKHEESLTKNVVMFDRFGNTTTATNQALVVCLIGDKAADTFLSMANMQADHDCYGIESGDEGVFVFNEWEEEYQWFDEDLFDSLANAAKIWKEAEKRGQ